jgi:Zinc-finger associated domain (zf-AD)/Zinc finger, C2H2 type
MANFTNCDPLKSCRTCLVEHGAEVPLFTFNYDNARPSELLVFCTSLQVSFIVSHPIALAISHISLFQVLENDGLPAYICENCNYKLTISFDFCKMAKTSAAKLTECLKVSTPDLSTIDTLLDIDKAVDANAQFFLNNEDLLQTPVKAPLDPPTSESPKKLARNAKKVKPIKSKLQLDSLLAKHQKKMKTEKNSTVKIFKQQRKVKPKVAKKGETCPECGKTFSYKGYLECHLRTHSKEKPFVCPVCAKRFGQSSNLALHIKIHNNTRNHQCEICSKMFVSNSNLVAHKRIHIDVRNFQCTDCDLAFKCQKDLTRHAVVHTNEKNHSCAICSKRFHKKAYLNQHMRTVHVGEKRFKCKECGKDFSSSSNLTCHFRIHSGVKPYACKHLNCTAKFNQSQALRRHQRAHDKPSSRVVVNTETVPVPAPVVAEIPDQAQDICFGQREEPSNEVTYSHQLPTTYHHTTDELLHEPHYLRETYPTSSDLTAHNLHHQEETQMINVLSDQSSVSSSNDSTFNFHATIPPTIPSLGSNFENYYKIPPYQHQYSEYDIHQQYNTIHNQYSDLSFGRLASTTNNYIGLPYQ